MKLDDIIAAAKRVICDEDHDSSCDCAGGWAHEDDNLTLAEFVVELLGASPPCDVTVEATHAQHLGSDLFLRIRGIKDFAIVPDGVCYALAKDARGVAAAVLRAAEEAP